LERLGGRTIYVGGIYSTEGGQRERSSKHGRSLRSKTRTQMEK